MVITVRQVLATVVALLCVGLAAPAHAAKNKAPQLAIALAPAFATEGSAFSYAVPAFTDPEGGPITYSAGGQPAWLAFNATTRQFSGTPPFTETTPGKLRKYRIAFSATDNLGKRKTKKFTLKVSDAVQPPPPPPVTLILAHALPDEIASEDSGYTFTVPSGTFEHSAGGEFTLSYAGLPPGTHEVFGGSGLGFEFIPTAEDVGEYLITVTASAVGATSVSDTFLLTVKPVNDAPTTSAMAPLEYQVTEDVPFSFVLPDGLFADEDGDTLTLSIQGGTQFFHVQFDPATRTMSGTAPETFVNPTVFYYEARDPSGLGVSISVNLTVAPVDDLPVLQQPLLDVYLPQGRSLYFTPVGRFFDPDDQLSFAYSGVPSWAQVDGWTLYGMPGPADSGVYVVTVTASDGKGHEVSDEFTITVEADNHSPVAPRFEIVGPDALVGSPYAFVLPEDAFTDPDGDALTIEKTSGPAWLAFDPATQTFSGTPLTAEPVFDYAHLRATDPSGASATAMLRVFLKANPDAQPPRYKVTGRIIAQPNSAVDSDTDDDASPYAPNNFSADAQSIGFKPALISGFVTEQPTGIPGSRFQVSGDAWDTYRMALAAGDLITLQISDHLGEPNSVVDLDLFLEDPVSGDLLAFSVGVGPGEQIVVAQAGTYNIVVNAFSGMSNYLLSFGPGSAPALRIASVTDRSEFVPGEAIVRSRDGGGTMRKGGKAPTLRLARIDATAAHGLATKARVPALDLWRDRPIADPALAASLTTARAVKLLAREPDVISVDLNYIRRPLAVPNDPLLSRQWHYRQINLPLAWEVTRGDPSVIVAVIDTGVVLSHPDLAPNLIAGYDFISSTNRARDGDGIDADPDDPGDGALLGESSFHGTHVAGTIAAATDNGIGVAGVAGGSRIMPLRVLGKGGGTSYDVIQAVRYAAGLANDSGTVPAQKADVINLSLGGGGYSTAEQEVYSAARAAGVIVVAAAGNEATDLPSFPASYDGVISVSAVDQRRARARYSNHGAFIDLAAPGGDMSADADGDGEADGVLSTLAVTGSDAIQPTYNFLDGTSMAAPHVAGVFALMRSILPELSPEQLDQEIRNGALSDDLGADGPALRNDQFGYGLINAVKAVARAQEIAATPAPPSFAVAEPQSLFLPFSVAEAIVTLRQFGGDSAQVTSIVSSSPALSTAPFGIDAQGFGTYRVAIDRTGLAAGAHTMSIDFHTDSAGVARVWVEVQVSPPTTLQFDNGMHYVLVVDPTSYTAIAEASVIALDGVYAFEVTGVPDGVYFVVVGTDHDGDYFICDAGEACGAFPSLGQLREVVVSGGDVVLPDLTTAVQQSIGAQLVSPAVQSRTPTGLLRRPPAE